MGLETFNFIPNLVDTNPEPTDPVAQGDDHLRGIKFTLQNQWPNIGEDQVTRTALQMNDAALRTGGNVFTGAQTVNDNDWNADALSDGPVGFVFRRNSQLRWNTRQAIDAEGNDWQLTRYVAGVEQDIPIRVLNASGGVNFSATVTAAGSFRAPDNDAVTPSYGFTNNTNMGMYRDASNVLGFSTLSTKRLTIFATEIRAEVPFSAQPGSAAGPSHTFQANLDLGMYRQQLDTLGFAANGVEQLRLSTQEARFAQNLRGIDGSAGAPTYAFSNTTDLGVFRVNSSTLGFAASGINRLQVGATVQASVAFRGTDGSAAAPEYAFTNGFEAGMYRPAANQLGLSTGGVEALRIDTIQQCTLRRENTVTRPVDTQARTGWRYTNLANQPQWAIYLGTSPSNVLSFQRYSATGTFLDIPFQLNQERGTVRMPTLPTSSAGLLAGDCWRNPISPGFVAIV